MKKTSIVLTGILALALFSCQHKQKKITQENQTDKKTVLSSQVVMEKTDIKNVPIHITKDDFLNNIMDYNKNPKTWVYKGELPCLIDFYAEWCAPCRLTAPIMDDLAREYAGKIIIYKVDVDKERELASVFGVQSIPTFLFCPLKGNPSITSGIAGSPEETRAMFKKRIESALLTN